MQKEPAHIISLCFRLFHLQHRKLCVISFFIRTLYFILAWVSTASTENFMKDSDSIELNGELQQSEGVTWPPLRLLLGFITVLSGNISDLQWVSWPHLCGCLRNKASWIVSPALWKAKKRKHFGDNKLTFDSASTRRDKDTEMILQTKHSYG